ncbi:MAG: endopeptidase La [Candidatus Anammoxibacter sp.]
MVYKNNKTEKNKVSKRRGRKLKISTVKERKPVKTPDVLNVLTVKDTIVFPQMVTALSVSSEVELKLLDDVLANDRILVLAAQKNIKAEFPDVNDLYKIGTKSTVLQMLRMPDNSARILVQGLQRIKFTKFVEKKPYFKVTFEMLEDVYDPDDIEIKALFQNITDQFKQLIALVPNIPEDLQISLVNIESPSKLADLVASHLHISIAEKQEILEALNVKVRLQKINTFLTKELHVLKLATKIQTQAKTEIDKSQREYYLRQQLKAIQDELGEKDDRTVEINELRKKLKDAKLPEEALKESNRELDRLSKMSSVSAEYTVSRTYLDWMVSLPWSISTKDNIDLGKVHKILNEDHYDLEKVKERIVEYLAVLKLKKDMKGPILCFVGPPGTGKTSIGKSIARAMGRKFVRISLGGIKDEAEIRGHRRTYIGALPGRIIQGLRKAGSNNPVFMLDEIDKLGSDFRGDPSSALLEVLDSEQNDSFSDHYLDVAFDLTKIMFITTANLLDPIPSALRDRMEVLELPGYTEEEKIGIAKKFLISKQIKEHGLTKRDIEIDSNTIKKIIRDYTREAGLRNVEREIATICRKCAKKIASGKTKKIKITTGKLEKMLGPEKFFMDVAERTSDPGVATGLAWTAAGGDILFIETTVMPGNGKLSLTGQLGDVMKESAQAAMSYIRSHKKELKIHLSNFNKYDFHLHIPAGAIPKDGPSAGVTIAMSLISLLNKESILPTVAMTGEITLRGRVLPVGGIKEKVLAANRAGIKNIILPKRNRKDLLEIQQEVKDNIKFTFVEKLEDMLPVVFNHRSKKKKNDKKRQ